MVMRAGMWVRILCLYLLSIGAVSAATLSARPTADIGGTVAVTVTGAVEPGTWVTVVAKGSDERAYDYWDRVDAPGTYQLKVTSVPGEYEIRLCAGPPPSNGGPRGRSVLVRLPLKLVAAKATVSAPTRVAAGAPVTVRWSGPNNPRDYIAIGEINPRGEIALTYTYTDTGNPAQVPAPEKPGEYTIRYVLNTGNTPIAEQRITVTSVSAQVSAPAQGEAGSTIRVTWTGPNNPRDYLTVVKAGAPDKTWDVRAYYTSEGSPINVVLPAVPGSYEVRYLTGQTNQTLASAKVTVAPSTAQGLLSVTTTKPVSSVTGAVEIILDASGSMLQKLGAERRIDVAKRTLKRLTSTTVPSGTPFALRVFGREIDSCRTDLDVPLAPLNPTAVATRIDALVVKNNAKTPIGASLEKVAEDLARVKGERIVILITDGEETCGGDPPRAIAKLRASGVDVRVSIVGFAIDDPELAATFRRWSDAGGGGFFDARDAAGLDRALTLALRPIFEVVNSTGKVVATGSVGGEPVRVLAGSYTVRIKGRNDAGKSVAVPPNETANVTL